jgi:hypothetical protein
MENEQDRDRETVKEINRLNAVLIRVLGERRAAQVRAAVYLGSVLAVVYAGMAPKRWKP